MLRQQAYPVTVICQVFDLPTSSYYYVAQPADEQRVRTAIEQIVQTFPTYGSRRVAAQLRRPPYEMTVNRKRVQRLMAEMGLQKPAKRRKCRTTDSQHGYRRYPNRVQALSVTAPDQVWVSDITYIHLPRAFVYLAVIMDVFTRAIRGWQLSLSLDQQLTLDALDMALAAHVPDIHHSDQGSQYAANAYTQRLHARGVQISMAAQGIPEENGYAERLIRTIKEEEVDLCEYADFADALTQIGHFIEQVYQHKRIHSALGYLTPAEFEADWQQAPTEQMSSLSPA